MVWDPGFKVREMGCKFYVHHLLLVWFGARAKRIFLRQLAEQMSGVSRNSKDKRQVRKAQLGKLGENISSHPAVLEGYPPTLPSLRGM